MERVNKHYILIGNPGVGKSTTLNSYLNGYYFESGISFGSGITKVCRTVELNNNKYTDTPGISDIKYRQQAINEISKTISIGGNFIIIFVITLESGRIRPDDITTIKSVMESININIIYTIMINKIDKVLYSRLQGLEKDELTNRISKQLNYNRFIFIFNLHYDILSSKTNAMYMNETIRYELDKLVPSNIASSNINIESFPGQRELEIKKRQIAEDSLKIRLSKQFEEIKTKKLEQESDRCEFVGHNGCTSFKSDRYKYCDKHKCDRYKCPNKICSNGSMCSMHKCIVDSCKDTTDDGNICSSHTCLNCECRVSNISNYCSKHRCSVSGCTNSKDRGEYCSSHKCQNCNNKTSFGDYCCDHKCSLKGCKSNRSSSSTRCCEHLTKDDVESSKRQCYNCNNIIYGCDNYCPSHLCKVCYEDINRSYGSNCDTHGCSEYNCNNYSYENEYCSIHKCANGSCSKGVYNGSKYCPYHKCEKCYNSVVLGNVYCYDHLCLYSGCNNCKDNSKNYCIDHKCLNCEHSIIHGLRYCLDHKCPNPGCNNGVLSLSYCTNCYNNLLSHYMK